MAFFPLGLLRAALEPVVEIRQKLSAFVLGLKTIRSLIGGRAGGKLKSPNIFSAVESRREESVHLPVMVLHILSTAYSSTNMDWHHPLRLANRLQAAAPSDWEGPSLANLHASHRRSMSVL